MKRIYLASKSIDRATLLKNVNIPFDFLMTDTDEEPYKKKYRSNPIKLVEALAKAKAKNAKTLLTKEKRDSVIIAADTIVELDGEIIGKAKTERQAFQTLKRLMGRTHNLITGVAITETNTANNVFTHDSTEVKFMELTDEEIWGYVDSKEWKGRAGAYSISNKASLFIESINGSPSNVKGLPMSKIYEILKEKFDVNLL